MRSAEYCAGPQVLSSTRCYPSKKTIIAWKAGRFYGVRSIVRSRFGVYSIVDGLRRLLSSVVKSDQSKHAWLQGPFVRRTSQLGRNILDSLLAEVAELADAPA